MGSVGCARLSFLQNALSQSFTIILKHLQSSYIPPTCLYNPIPMPGTSVTSPQQHDVKVLSWHSIYNIYAL